MKEDQKLAATTGGAISISAISSFIGLCCIGPWAVALFGVTGAVAMARWQPFRPYILSVALILIAWAFWRVYGPARKKLCEAGLCPARPSIWLQGSLWFAAVLVVMAFFADQLQWVLVDPTPAGSYVAGEDVNKSHAQVTPTYIVLDEDLSQLINDFNAGQGKIRQVFIVGPTCGICLRGMADLNDEYIQDMQNDARLHTYVLHVPTMGAKEKDVPATIPLLQGPGINHYWDAGGHSGIDFKETLGIAMYAWDIWMLFDPQVDWEPGSLPPKPDFWQHQLAGLDRSLKLDKVEFGNEVKRLLGLLPESIKGDSAVSRAAKPDSEMIPVAQPRGVIIGQHIKMKGGYRRLKTISSIIYTGHTESNGKQYPLTIETHRPNVFIRTTEKNDQYVTVSWDGNAVSHSHEVATGIPKNVMDEILTGFDFDGWIVEWKDKGYKLWRLGMKKVADKLPWVMEAELPNGQVWQLYIDSHSGDHYRSALMDRDSNEKIVIEYDEFREVDGFRMPHVVRYFTNSELIATDKYSTIALTMSDAMDKTFITH